MEFKLSCTLLGLELQLGLAHGVEEYLRQAEQSRAEQGFSTVKKVVKELSTEAELNLPQIPPPSQNLDFSVSCSSSAQALGATCENAEGG